MEIMPYLCQAERQGLAKAYVSSLDLTLDAPQWGIQGCRTSKPRLCVSSMTEVSTKTARLFSLCLLIQ